MLFAIRCHDKPGHQDVRAGNRAAHLAYLEQVADRLVFAGPTFTDDGAAMTGSLLIIDLDDDAAVRDFCERDPYARAGLFDRVDVAPVKQVFPRG
jgi:hypothetical protein